MASRILPVSALLAGVALLLLGSGLLGTLLSVRAGLEGFSTTSIGLVMSAYFAGFLLGTRIAPEVIERVGHIRSFAIFAAVAACTSVLHPLSISVWSWALLRVVTGISIVGLFNVIESWLTVQADPASRGGLFAVYMIVNLVAMAAGQWLILASPVESFELFSIITVLFALSLVPVALTRLGQPDVTTVTAVPFRTVWTVAPVAIGGAFLSGIVMGGFWGMGPLFAQRVGLEQAGVALLMSLTIIGGAVMQLPIGHYSDRHDRRRVIGLTAAWGALLAAGTSLLLGYYQHALFPMMFLYGGFAFSIYPLCAAHLSDWLEADQLVDGSGWLLLMHGAGAALGPLAAGLFIGRAGEGSLPLFFGIVLLPLALFAAWHALPRRLDEELLEDQSSSFVPMVRTSPVVLELLAEEEEPEGGFIDPDAELDVEEGFIEDLGSYSPEAATEPGPPDSMPPGR
ncbi:MFS transporter [Algiphilus sp. NNCM1]|uniref:MFS transporter n=1 Tax=Algiphilus sp. TaxID=1872431 RepID=UPI001CA77799|nr:MFS transporter [Algiphilus sp.]MBY8965832.1 MFS transporter [Algiphilus acroporae]MCI5104635.1 MFS transporter [Algiphilus sp.]